MKVTIRGIREYDKHRMQINVWQAPTWVERLILGRRAGVVNYVGKGTRWFILDVGAKVPLQLHQVKDKRIINELQKIHP